MADIWTRVMQMGGYLSLRIPYSMYINGDLVRGELVSLRDVCRFEPIAASTPAERAAPETDNG